MALNPDDLGRLNTLLAELQRIRDTVEYAGAGLRIEGEMFEIMEPQLRRSVDIRYRSVQEAGRDNILSESLLAILTRLRTRDHLMKIKKFNASLSYFGFQVGQAAKNVFRELGKAPVPLSNARPERDDFDAAFLEDGIFSSGEHLRLALDRKSVAEILGHRGEDEVDFEKLLDKIDEKLTGNDELKAIVHLRVSGFNIQQTAGILDKSPRHISEQLKVIWENVQHILV